MIAASAVYRILAGAVAVAALLWLIQSRDHWRDKARANAQLFRAEKAAHAATVVNYRAAAERARREDAENLARVEAEQARINERTAHDFESRIAAARARADELRFEAATAAADRGSGGAAPVPRLPAAPERAPETAREDQLPEPDALIATEQAIQLDELIKWARRQAAVAQDGEPEAQQADVPVDVAPAEAGASGRKCADQPRARLAEMPACAGMTVKR
jgi:hypothetical protein